MSTSEQEKRVYVAIQVWAETRRNLKILAAQQGIAMCELVDRLARQEMERQCR
jgi:hypothetical protein